MMSFIYNYVSFSSLLFLCFHLFQFTEGSLKVSDSRLIINTQNRSDDFIQQSKQNESESNTVFLNSTDSQHSSQSTPFISKRVHLYYNSTVYTEPAEAMKYWVDIDEMPNVTLNPKLSNSSQYAASVNLTFDFPFYGHPIKKVSVTTGGFLFLGDAVHNWLAATQYVAPLMANFDTRLNESSKIVYADNSTIFVVQWENVAIKELPQEFFTFQVSLFSNGDIVFVYKDLPVAFNDIPDTHHPVKVGLSDAYLIDRIGFFIRRKKIYEYSRIDLKDLNISSNTSIYFSVQPTCNTLENRESCLIGIKGFSCKWCSTLERCSDGNDRMRQQWIENNCEI